MERIVFFSDAVFAIAIKVINSRFAIDWDKMEVIEDGLETED